MTDNKSLTFLSRLYVDHLQVMNYSERTVSHRATTLSQFSQWCEEPGIHRANEVTKPILRKAYVTEPFWKCSTAPAFVAWK
jgi:integrase/recombinase XerD